MSHAHRALDDQLANFLETLTPFAEANVEWTIGTLHPGCYLTESEPPHCYLMSGWAGTIEWKKTQIRLTLSWPEPRIW